MTILHHIETFTSRHTSDKTKTTYSVALAKFLEYLNEHDLSSESYPNKIPLSLLLQYPAWLQAQRYEARRGAIEAPYALATQELYVLVLKRFILYLAAQKQLSFEYSALINNEILGPTKGFVPIGKKTPSDEVIAAILEIVEAPLPPDIPEKQLLRRQLTRLRNIALIYALIGSGARVSEIASLTVGDLQKQSQTWVAWIQGKRQKTRLLSFGNEAGQKIQDYLKQRDQDYSADHYSLFCRHDQRVLLTDRKALSVRSIQLIVRDLALSTSDKLGYTVHVSPHSFRHYLARSFLNQGGDLTHLQVALGHSSLATTGIYTSPNLNEVAQAIGNIKIKR